MGNNEPDASQLRAALEWLVSDMEHTANIFNMDPACIASLVQARNLLGPKDAALLPRYAEPTITNE